MKTLFAAFLVVLSFMLWVPAALAQWSIVESGAEERSEGWLRANFVAENPAPERVNVDDKPSRVHVRVAMAKIDLFGLTVVPVGQVTDTFEVYEDRCNGPFAITGSFFKTVGPEPREGEVPEREADGWVVIAGEHYSERVNWTSGGAIVDDGTTVSVVRLANLGKLRSPWMLIQSKPIVIESGQPGVYSSDGEYSDWRSVIGIASEDYIFAAVLVGGGDDGMTLFDVSNILKALDPYLPDRAHLVDIIAMDGGPGAHLYLPRTNEHFGGLPPVYVPNLICVTPRGFRP